MSEEPAAEEPPWELLPHQPRLFFELEPDFDKRELKRRYTRLIKRYKPERSPDEFQRIRAAYESLLDDLRSGARRRPRSAPLPPDEPGESKHEEPKPRSPKPAEAPAGDESAEPPESATPSAPNAAPALGKYTKPEPISTTPPGARSLLERIDQDGAQAAYDLLRAKQPKQPADYPRLGVLADLCDEQRTFFDWLLEGIRAHPDDEGIEQSLRNLLRDGLPLDTIPSAIQRLSRSLTPGRFYALSLPLWLSLVRRQPFAEIEELLAACEAEVHSRGLVDTASTPRLLFHLRLLRAACWRAPSGWIQETLAFLSQHHARLPEGLESELDFVELMLDYLAVRSRFLDGRAGAEAVDACLQAYCEQPEAELDRLFLARAQELRGRGEELLWEFDPEDQPASLALATLLWVARDVESRRFSDSPRLTRDQVGAELRRLEQGYRGDPRWELFHKLPGSAAGLLVIGLPVIALALIPALRAQPLYLVGAFVGWTLLQTALGARSPFARVRGAIAEWCLGRSEALNQRLYLRRLRPALSRFLLRTHVRARTLADLIEATCDPPEAWSWNTRWLAGLVRTDPGVGLLALANRFARV